MVRIVGAPFDLCGRAEGSRMGPAAMRLAGLTETLVGLGIPVEDLGDFQTEEPEPENDGFRALNTYLALASNLKNTVEQNLRSDIVTLVLGGDHSLGAGSVSGALGAFGRDLAVLWIDAHADLNTPDLSPTGNLHGMPLGLLMGLPTQQAGTRGAQWRLLQRKLLAGPVLKQDRAAWLGLRDVDPPEAKLINSFGQAYVATMHDIDRKGILSTVETFDLWLRNSGAKKLWISFDVDCLDPVLAPGTGTAVRGGLSYREAHLVAELLHESLSNPDCPYSLAGLDILETNPMLDSHNMTAVTAVEWVASLFGKTILGKR